MNMVVCEVEQPPGVFCNSCVSCHSWRESCDGARVPDLSVRGITSICGGGDSRDPTTNEQVMAP